jgi:hypothetical protein
MPPLSQTIRTTEPLRSLTITFRCAVYNQADGASGLWLLGCEMAYIVVVEDNEDVAEVVSDALRSEGHR